MLANADGHHYLTFIAAGPVSCCISPHASNSFQLSMILPSCQRVQMMPVKATRLPVGGMPKSGPVWVPSALTRQADWSPSTRVGERADEAPVERDEAFDGDRLAALGQSEATGVGVNHLVDDLFVAVVPDLVEPATGEGFEVVVGHFW